MRDREKMKILLVPLDERPICWKPFIKLAKIGGFDIKLNLDFRLNEDNIQDYKPEVVIVSLDRILFGGLAESRELSNYVDVDSKLTKFTSQFEEVLSSEPMYIYIFSSIPRILPTNLDDLELIDAILEHSKGIYHKAKQFLKKGLELEKVYEVIERELRERGSADKVYTHVLENLYIRQAKREVHLKLIDWAKEYEDKVQVVIGLDDAQTEGLWILEYFELLSLREQFSSLHILHGVDQLPYLILARHLSRTLKNNQSIVPKIIYSEPNASNQKNIYERVTLEKLISEVKDFVSLSGGGPSQDFEILINATPDYQAEASEQLRNYRSLTHIGPLQDQKHLKIADVRYANGGDLELLPLILNNLTDLEVYWGWNTTSNTLGTAFCHAYIVELAKLEGTFNSDYNLELVLERILDDLFYKSIVRPELNSLLRARGYKISELSSQGSLEVAIEFTRCKLEGLLREWKLPIKLIEVKFPFDRTFEVELNIETKFA